jgi:hypothetical protein
MDQPVAGKADKRAHHSRKKNQKSQTLAHEIPGAGIEAPRFLCASLAAAALSRHAEERLLDAIPCQPKLSEK